jgi:hypothetical protein
MSAFLDFRDIAATNVSISLFYGHWPEPMSANPNKKDVGAANVRISTVFGHSSRPTPLFLEFADIGPDQCPEFSSRKTLIAPNVQS